MLWESLLQQKAGEEGRGLVSRIQRRHVEKGALELKLWAEEVFSGRSVLGAGGVGCRVFWSQEEQPRP